jgi:hypothetical protein
MGVALLFVCGAAVGVFWGVWLGFLGRNAIVEIKMMATRIMVIRTVSLRVRCHVFGLKRLRLPAGLEDGGVAAATHPRSNLKPLKPVKIFPLPLA